MPQDDYRKRLYEQDACRGNNHEPFRAIYFSKTHVDTTLSVHGFADLGFSEATNGAGKNLAPFSDQASGCSYAHYALAVRFALNESAVLKLEVKGDFFLDAINNITWPTHHFAVNSRLGFRQFVCRVEVDHGSSRP